MREGRWRFLPPVVQPVDVLDWHLGKFFFVLKRYSVISCSPASKRKPAGLATATQNRFLLR